MKGAFRWTLLLLVGVALAIPSDDAPRSNCSGPDDCDWVASTQGSVYYGVGCRAAGELSPSNRIYFRSATEARSAGYRPSRSPGCADQPEAGSRSTASRDSGERSSAAGSIAPPVRAADDRCRVERVTDGDTFVCAGGRRVRLLLIDAPEMQQGPYGARARRELQRLLAPGTTARLEYDVEKRDRYGRTLAYVYDPAGTMVNEAMLRSGYAVVIVYPPNVQYVERMRAAAADAREAKRGLWATNAFDCTPRDYRRSRCR